MNFKKTVVVLTLSGLTLSALTYAYAASLLDAKKSSVTITAKQMSVPMNVTRRTRTGIAYQRGGRGVGGMLIGYTIRRCSIRSQIWMKKFQVHRAKISGINKLRGYDPVLIWIKY